jgi:hypothetical protein
MEKLLELLWACYRERNTVDVPFEHSQKISTRSHFEDALDDYIDKRIEDAMEKHEDGHALPESSY